MTIKEKILELGYEERIPSACFGGDQLVDGKWYVPKWGCDTLQHIIDEWGEEGRNGDKKDREEI